MENDNKDLSSLEEDLLSYSLEDLNQLVELNKKAIDYFQSIIQSKDTPEDAKLEYELCIKFTKLDLTMIEEHISKKKNEF